MHRKAETAASEDLRNILHRNRGQEAVGAFSVCSAHPRVLQAAMRQARDDETMLCVESTSNQVNQYRGYTGLTPAQFVDHLRAIARSAAFPQERLLLGGDHLGPYPWRGQSAEQALEQGCELVRACVRAGYVKIHLDASMPCAGDSRLHDEQIAARAAALCRAAEDAWTELPSGSPPLLYVVGTEVPTPGGETAAGEAPQPTSGEQVHKTLDISRAAFFARGLQGAWERVIALVVQPGVEFGDAVVFDYDRTKARPLSASLPLSPALVYEAHSTDYQRPPALRQMVEDHFAILKVGPWLTFALREAVFALSILEREWLGHRRGVRLSRVREQLDEAMLRNPVHWKSYYPWDEPEAQFARRYSYSDRCRYYWPDAAVQGEMDLLLANLSAMPMPVTLLSQYLPRQYEAVRAGTLRNRPGDMIDDRIREVLRIYAAACGKI